MADFWFNEGRGLLIRSITKKSCRLEAVKIETKIH
jgi:hypothetical protein